MPDKPPSVKLLDRIAERLPRSLRTRWFSRGLCGTCTGWGVVNNAECPTCRSTGRAR